MLRLTPAGMEMLEFIPNNNLLRFLADTTLPSVKVFQGGVGSRHASSLQIDSGQQVLFQKYFDTNTSYFSRIGVDMLLNYSINHVLHDIKWINKSFHFSANHNYISALGSVPKALKCESH